MGSIRFFLLSSLLLFFLRALPVRMLAAWAVAFLPFGDAVAKTMTTLVPSFGRRIFRIIFSLILFSFGPQDELILLFLGKIIKRFEEECLLSSCGLRVDDSAVLMLVKGILGVLIKRIGCVFR